MVVDVYRYDGLDGMDFWDVLNRVVFEKGEDVIGGGEGVCV